MKTTEELAHREIARCPLVGGIAYEFTESKTASSILPILAAHELERQKAKDTHYKHMRTITSKLSAVPPVSHF